MKRLLSAVWLVIEVVAAVAVFGITGTSAAESGKDSSAIRLGMSVPLTGPVAAYGTAMMEGVRACFAQVNAEGGIKGRKIELIGLDDGYETEKTLANTRKLINEEKVLALVGYFGSPSTGEAMQAFWTAGVPLIGLATGASSLHIPPGRYAFNTRASVEKEASVLVDHMVTLGSSRIGVVYQDDSFGRAGYDGLSEALKRYKLQPAVAVAIDPKSGDVSGAAQRVASVAPQAVVILTTYKPVSAFIRALKKAGAPTQVATVSLVGADLLISELGVAESHGVIISQVTPYPWNDTVKIVRDYQRAARAINPSAKPSYYGLEGYIIGRIAVEALKRAGPDAEPDDLVSALEKGPIDLGGYYVSYRPGLRQGSQFVDITILGREGRVLR
jgi:ABC-type branched-subunit amino acid transport system substrate-binding protein